MDKIGKNEKSEKRRFNMNPKYQNQLKNVDIV